MVVLVIAVVMAVRMRMSGTVSMRMFVFVEHDLQPPAERRGDAAKSVETRNMIAALQARDHRLRHTQAQRQLFLRFAGMSAELDESPRALGRERSKNAMSSDLVKLRIICQCQPSPAPAQKLLDSAASNSSEFFQPHIPRSS
jgi:hypothetical protein